MKKIKYLIISTLVLVVTVMMFPNRVQANEKVYETLDRAQYQGEKMTKEYLVDLSDGKYTYSIKDHLDTSKYKWVAHDEKGLIKVHSDDFHGSDKPITNTKPSYGLYSEMAFYPFILMVQNANYIGGGSGVIYETNEPFVDSFDFEWQAYAGWQKTKKSGEEVGVGFDTNDKKLITVKGYLDGKAIVEHQGQEIELNDQEIDTHYFDRYEYTLDPSILDHDDMVYDLHSQALQRNFDPNVVGKIYKGYGFLRIKFKKNLYVDSSDLAAGSIKMSDETNSNERDVALKNKMQYKKGKKVTLKASPKEGYEFVGWEENGKVISNDSTFNFEMNSDKNIVAKWKKKATITVKYVDINTKKEIINGIVINSFIGDPINVKQKDIEGYTFVEAKGNTTGTIEKTNETITYFYKNKMTQLSIVKDNKSNLKSSVPKTGDSSNINLLFTSMTGSLLLGIYLCFKLKRS